MASLSPGGVVAFGVLVGLVSTCVQSIGLTLQRKSHILEDEKGEDEPRRAPYRRRRWQIGMVLFLLSNIVGSSIQITTLPLPLLSTLQASGLVFNALLASLLLQEPFTRRTGLGTLLVAAGAVLISFFSALPEPSHSLDQLLELLVVPNFVIWMTMTLLVVVAVLGGCFFIAHILPIAKRRSPRYRLIRGMGYGLMSGILSAHSLLLAKSAVELLVRTIADHHNQFGRYQSWMLLLIFLFFALTQLYYLHRGLKLVSTSILYPFVFCIYNIIAILDGLIYFRQTDRLPPLHAGLVALGTVILLTGVLALSWRLSDEKDHTDPAASDPLLNGGKADLPQTALTPGMGFVDDHRNGSPTAFLGTTTSRDVNADEESALNEGETEPLLRRHSMRDSAMLEGRRRHRRNTVREVEDIWSELRDENDDGEEEAGGRMYSAIEGVNHSSASLLARRNKKGDSNDALSRLSGGGDAKGVGRGLARSKTAPVKAKERRRRSTLGIWGRTIGSSELAEGSDAADKRKSWAGSIKLDWWRKRRRGNDQDPQGADDASGQGASAASDSPRP